MPGKKSKNTSVYIGTSGLVLPVPKYRFPEAYRDYTRLAYYGTFFNSIEINSSFYRLPLAKTVVNWAAQVPGDFKFTFKLWREISHKARLEFKEEEVERFFAVISGAGSKKGFVLIQFPPSISMKHVDRIEALLQCVNRSNRSSDWRIAVECRNRSLYNPEVYALLREENASLVMHDMPGSATPFNLDHAGFLYLRFHGPTGNYKGTYSDDLLHEYGSYIKAWQKSGKTVYVYFNNTIGEAFKNAQILKGYLE